MLGLDASHYQNGINWQKVKAAGYQFAFAKCTEGVGFIDKMYQQNKVNARKAGVLFGSYHFTNHNDPIKEAQFFVKSVGDIQQGELLALDSETGQSPQWCLLFLQEVERLVGFKPLLYINASTVKRYDWAPVVKENFGLWVAKYASSSIYVPYWLQIAPSAGKWPFWAIWQYSSRGKVNGIVGNVDTNYTKMSIQTLKKYGKQ